MTLASAVWPALRRRPGGRKRERYKERGTGLLRALWIDAVPLDQGAGGVTVRLTGTATDGEAVSLLFTHRKAA